MRIRFKTKVLERFMEMVATGSIKAYEPIPNNVFTFEELNDLYNNGYLYIFQYHGKGEFRAVP